MSARRLDFLVPGDLRGATGGYVYDRSMAAGLRALGWNVRVHRLHASFPQPTTEALAHAEHVLECLPDEACVLVDGLALGAMPQQIEAHSRRLTLIALTHTPLALRVGLADASAEHLRRQERRALELVRHVIVTSRTTERDLEGCGVDPSRVSGVEPGVWLKPIANDPDHRTTDRDGDRGGDRGSDRGSDRAVRMLCVATVHEGKGHELLIDALVPLAHLAWQLWCVGSLVRSPATAQRLVDRLRSAALIDRVALVGEVPHAALSELYLAADLFVLPTLRESYGMAVAESLAHGLPVVSTRTGAIPQLVGGAAGLLTEPGDRDALRAALQRALEHRELRSSWRAAALEARGRLTPWPRACALLAQVLERVCACSERERATDQGSYSTR